MSEYVNYEEFRNNLFNAVEKEPLKICPKCGKVMSYNSWFHAYLCPYCDNIIYTDRTASPAEQPTRDRLA